MSVSRSTNPVVYDPVLQHMLLSLGAAAPTPILTGAKVGLFTNSILPTRHTKLADMVEPTDTWYTKPALTLSAAPYLNDDNNLAMEGAVAFTVSGMTGPGTMVVGYFVEDGAATELLICEKFA